MKLNLHVDKLILDEHVDGDRHRIAAAVRHDLEQRVATSRLSTTSLNGGHISRLRAVAVEDHARSMSRRVATGLAAAIHRGVARE